MDVKSEQLTAKDLHAPNGFAHSFKQRHLFSFRRAHDKWRPLEMSRTNQETIRHCANSI
jgi:hypothetical protein